MAIPRPASPARLPRDSAASPSIVYGCCRLQNKPAQGPHASWRAGLLRLRANILILPIVGRLRPLRRHPRTQHLRPTEHRKHRRRTLSRSPTTSTFSLSGSRSSQTYTTPNYFTTTNSSHRRGEVGCSCRHSPPLCRRHRCKPHQDRELLAEHRRKIPRLANRIRQEVMGTARINIQKRAARL